MRTSTGSLAELTKGNKNFYIKKYFNRIIMSCSKKSNKTRIGRFLLSWIGIKLRLKVNLLIYLAYLNVKNDDKTPYSSRNKLSKNILKTGYYIAPKTFDWRSKGKVTTVKDQG